MGENSVETKQLPVGKVDPRILLKKVFKYLGYPREEVVYGPSIGGDAAVVRLNNVPVVFKTDPIVGASKNIGKLAVNVVSNDVACLGAEPIAITLTILLPEGSFEDDIEEIMKSAHDAARKLKISIVGGHTEVAMGLKGRPPIVIASAIGIPVAGEPILPTGVKPGDKILMTKTVATEGTSILASEFEKELEERLGKHIVEKAKRFSEKTSIIKEALILARNKIVHGMHDPTDGGLLEGLYEFSEAANLGFIVWENKIPIAKETYMIAKYFKIDPLKLISSGVLLAAIPKNKVEEAVKLLRRENIEASIIGEFVEERSRKLLVRRNGAQELISEPVIDELWNIFKLNLEKLSKYLYKVILKRNSSVEGGGLEQCWMKKNSK